jgi:hypothetical protein
MGIGGHILGDKKLRQLRAKTGVPFDRAFRMHWGGEGVVWTADGCEHYGFDWKTGQTQPLTDPRHWTSCDPTRREHVHIWRAHDDGSGLDVFQTCACGAVNG